MAKICIIVPVYNVEKYLNRCIDSILAQTFADFELVLVDNASTDSSSQICDNYAKKDGRITVIHETKKFGPGHGRNLGLNWLFKNSNCEYIAHIDSDDWLATNYLESLYNAIVETGADVSVCKFKQSSAYPIKFSNDKELFTPIIHTDIESFFCDTVGYFGALWCKLFKRKLFENVVFPQIGIDDGKVTHEVMFSAKRIAYFPAELYCYFENPNSFTHNKQKTDKSSSVCEAYFLQACFFHDHGYRKAYPVAFKRYCNSVRYLDIFDKNHNELYEYRKNQIELLNNMMKQNSDILSLKQHRKIDRECKSRIKRLYKKACINYFKNDVENIKKSKGLFSSYLWLLKNCLRINKIY